MENTLLFIENTKTVLDKLRFLILGDSHHKWMYDEKSLCRLLESAGSANPSFGTGKNNYIRYRNFGP